jgi:hypothetical protein
MAEDTLQSHDDGSEQWRSIPGHSGYDLSSDGRVRSWRAWLGCHQNLPRILKIQQKGNRRWIQLGLHGGRHELAVLMHEIWGTPLVVKGPRLPQSWRRLMLSDRQHADLVKTLELVDSVLTRRLLVAIRTAKKVGWDDVILPEEVPHEEEP